MGSGITIDKHLTNIEEWFQVTDKLDSIDFDAGITSHIGLWKIAENDKHQIASTPVFIQTQSLDQLFSKHDCYVFYAIKKSDHDNPETIEPVFSTHLNLCIENLKNNILKICYQTSLKSQSLEGHQYRIYSLFGRKSKHQLRLMTTSYCLRLNDALNSTKKLAIFSGGGVLRNKKLQKGSILPFQSHEKNQAGNFNIINLNVINQNIDFVQFFTESSGSSFNLGVQNPIKKTLSIFSYKPKCQLPEIKTQKMERPEAMQLAESEVSAYSSSKNFPERESEMIDEPRPQKKNEVKMNLKLDFSKPLNLSGLNLASKKSETEQSSINSIQNIGITNRSEERRGKREKCEEECSEIIEGLYVSGEKVARNYETLQKHQIKYIINCAGDYCQNWFEDRSIEYLTFFLKDSQNENIECLFYKVIDFVQAAHKNKENVLIHCIQGISRSVTFVIAYIIFKYGYDYKKAESFVKQKRSIACPNNGFMVQLIQFHKRLYDEYQSLANPRVFMVSSHSKETPHILAARMLKVTLFDSKKYIGFDSRAVYVIHLPDVVYIWAGSKCSEAKLQSYWTHANQFVKKLQKYERAPLKVKTVSEGSEEKEFLAIWNLAAAPKIYEGPEYDRFFVEGQPARPGQQRQYYEQIEEEDSQSKKLYIYPDHKTGLGVFSLEDLNGMCILAIVSEEKAEKHLKLHIWKNDQFETEEDNSEEDFLSKVIETNFGDFDDENIEIIEEDYEKPSQIFRDCFKN